MPMTETTAVNWIDSTSWEPPFFGLPQRIPWPADVDPALANSDIRAAVDYLVAQSR